MCFDLAAKVIEALCMPLNSGLLFFQYILKTYEGSGDSFSVSFLPNFQDCDKAIELDPTFIKAYLRKAKVHIGMGQTSKAQATYEKALELDPNCAEALEGYRSCSIQR